MDFARPESALADSGLVSESHPLAGREALNVTDVELCLQGDG